MSSRARNRNRTSQTHAPVILAVGYGVLIVYASLFPLSGWRAPQDPPFSFLLEPWPAHLSRSDLLVNVLAYIPLGALLVWAIRMRAVAAAVGVATATGLLLSFSMESLQMFLPARTSSLVDLLTNVIGTFIGAILASILSYRPAAGRLFRNLRNRWFLPGVAVDVALLSVMLWICAQLSPFVPSMDVSSIRAGLAPTWHALHNPAALDQFRIAVYACDIAGLTAFLMLLVSPARGVRFILLLGFATVLACKPFIVTRQLSLEALVGFAIGSAALLLPGGPSVRATFVGAAVVAGFVISELQPAPGATHAFNWVPLLGELDNNVKGFGAIFAGVWPFAVLGSLRLLAPATRSRTIFLAGTALLLVLVFGLEWHQQYVPGRYGDITAVLLALVGWVLPAVLHRSLVFSDARLACGRESVSDGPAAI